MIRICIIGAGWYGCHIALSLRALGFEVTLLERNETLLSEASGNNQFRLHQGFHYPRHHGTRVQSRDGFMRFIERYPTLSRAVPENIYAVPREESLLDFPTYRLVMTSSGLDFRETDINTANLRDVGGILLAGERVLLIEKARRYFMTRLAGVLQTGIHATHVKASANCVRVEGEVFDYVIDATWGHRGGLPIRTFFEPTLLLYYETHAPFPAVTLVDGPLCSIYPTEDLSIYTLSSVPHTPLGRSCSSARAHAIRDAVDGQTIAARREAMERQISRYIPDFRDRFHFLGPQLSIKTKPTGKYDDRSCYVFRNGRIFTVMSGKIDTIFFAVERILAFIENSGEELIEPAASPLRSRILNARRLA